MRTACDISKRFYPSLLKYLEGALSEMDNISSDRKGELEQVSRYVRGKVEADEPAKLIFICTHNSRRSHLSQIWAQVASQYFGVPGVETFSGGTEATAFNPRAVAAMARCGLHISATNPNDTNPHYQVQVADDLPSQVCFSKIYDAPPNPKEGYCAIMTCSQADEACPLVFGCELRAPIRYEDPKIADDTEMESTLYDERARQICREMLYLMAKV